MGVVYKSWHPQLHRPVAIKILSASRATDAPSIARFQREMRAAGGLDHRGIVRAVDAGVWQGTYYLVMEYIDGIDLSRLVQRSGPLNAADACEVIVQAAESLQFAHENQVIHRDIKPSNLILSRDGTVKILDFGLARLEQNGLASHDATTAGRLIGTLDYLAPEQAEGIESIDARSDIYGLGATLYRLLAGRPPHGSSQNRPILQYLQELTQNDPKPIETFRSDLPTQLCEIASQLLARDPKDRPATANQVAELLRPFAADSQLATLASESITVDDADPTEVVNASVEMPLDGDSARSNSPNHLTTEETQGSNQQGGIERRRSGGNRFGSWVIAIALFMGAAGGWSGVTLWLKSGDASIQVESEVDDVSLQLIKDGRVASEIEVHPGDEVTRVRVGKYELRIAGATDHVRLDQNSLLLMRGDQRIVRITRDAVIPDQHEVSTSPPELPNDELTSKGRTYNRWTDIVLRETDPSTVVDVVRALASLSTPELHSQTYATLMNIARGNESRGSDVICDDYIGFLTHREDKNSRKETRVGNSTQAEYMWNKLYPKVD